MKFTDVREFLLYITDDNISADRYYSLLPYDRKAQSDMEYVIISFAHRSYLRLSKAD